MPGPFFAELKEISLTFCFSQINDNAFTKEWVEQVFEKLGKSWLFHDIPGQEALVQVDQSGIIPCGTHQTLQPPVGNGVRSLILTISVLRHEVN